MESPVDSAESGPDQELRKAFQEMQSKLLDTKRQLRLADIEIDDSRRSIRKAELTKSELESVPTEADTYLAVGRMFLKQTRNVSLDCMSKQISDAELKIAGLENKKAYLERNLKESETNLREMVAARRLNR